MKTNPVRFVRAALTAILLTAFATSCTVVHGDQTKGTYTLATVGGDVKDYAQTAAGVTVASLDNSTSFRSASDTIRKMVYAQIAGGVLKNVSNSWRSVANTKTAADVSKVKAVEGTKQASIAADAATKQAEISAQTEQAAISAGQ